MGQEIVVDRHIRISRRHSALLERWRRDVAETVSGMVRRLIDEEARKRSTLTEEESLFAHDEVITSKTQELIFDRLAARIKELRMERGWSQKDLAERLGLSTAFINHLHHRHRHPSLETLFKIASIFDVEIGQLFSHSAKNSRKRK